MKFKCHKETLLKEINIAQDIISSRNSASILSNIYLSLNENNLEIKATDLKVNFKTTIPVEGNENGEAKIFCDKFINIIKNFPDEEILFKKEDNNIILRNEKNKINYSLKSIPKDDYPEFKTIENNNYFPIKLKTFISMINQTLFAISNDEIRYQMNGINFNKTDDKLTMVATDGRRLSIISKKIETNIPNFESIIIPPKILNIIKKYYGTEGNIYLAIIDNLFYIKIENNFYSSNLIDGQFPNYKRVIPEIQTNSFSFKKNQLLDAIKRVDLLVEKNTKKIIMDIQANSILLSSSKNDFGVAKESINCDYTGDQFLLSLNSKHIEEPLKAIDTEDIEIEFTSNNKAITVFPKPKKDYFHIIMPLQNY